MARKFAGRSHVVRSKRQVTWIGTADQGYVAVASTAKVLLSSFDPFAVGIIKPTIVRTRGMYSIKPDVFTANLDIVGAWGVAIVSDDAFAVGITAIPGPFSDSNWDGWMAHEFFAVHLEDLGTAVETVFPADVRFNVDSKGMRKVSDNETVVHVAESEIGNFLIAEPIRTLYKLS